jgi:hypothetical protein
MGLFFSDSQKPRITEKEFKEKVRGALYGNNFTPQEVNWVEEYFRGDMYEGKPIEQGVQADELARAIAWLRVNPTKHKMNSVKVDAIEKVMMRML